MTGPTMLRALSRLEGASLLALVGVAMPLKYLADFPLAVRVVGMVHGVLFLALLATAFRVVMERALTTRQVLRVLGWALLPLGFLVVDRELGVGGAGAGD